MVRCVNLQRGPGPERKDGRDDGMARKPQVRRRWEWEHAPAQQQQHTSAAAFGASPLDTVPPIRSSSVQSSQGKAKASPLFRPASHDAQHHVSPVGKGKVTKSSGVNINKPPHGPGSGRRQRAQQPESETMQGGRPTRCEELLQLR